MISTYAVYLLFLSNSPSNGSVTESFTGLADNGFSVVFTSSVILLFSGVDLRFVVPESNILEAFGISSNSDCNGGLALTGSKQVQLLVFI